LGNGGDKTILLKPAPLRRDMQADGGGHVRIGADREAGGERQNDANDPKPTQLR